MADQEKTLAELVAMRARGELTDKQFEEAKRLAQIDDVAASPNSSKPVAKPPQKKGGCLSSFFGFVVIIVAILWVVGKVSPNSSSPSSNTTSATSTTSAEDAENRRKGFHCLSAWDGSDRELVKAVTESLRDPDSFEHVETRITPVNAKGQHALVMKFRAKNGFGGMNVGTAIGTIKQSDCSLVSWSMLSDN